MHSSLILLSILISFVQSFHLEKTTESTNLSTSNGTAEKRVYNPFQEFHWHSLRLYIFPVLVVVVFVIVKFLSEIRFCYCRLVGCNGGSGVRESGSQKEQPRQEVCSAHSVAAGEILPESAFLVTAGLLCALLLLAMGVQGDQALSPGLIFQVMLAPIVMAAAWSADKLVIYRNLGTILVFAMLGTIFNSAIIAPLVYYGSADRWGVYGSNLSISAIDSGMFSVLICAVDPVAVLSVFESMHIDKLVHNVVFGESLLNDGVAVVFYNAFSEMKHLATESSTGDIDLPLSVAMAFLTFLYAVLMSAVLALVAAALVSLASKIVHKHEACQIVLVIALNYLTFILADLLKASGIITLFFSVLCQRQYVQANLSATNNQFIAQLLHQLSLISEGVIFILMGLTTFSSSGLLQPSANDLRFSLYMILVCYLSRFLVVYMLGFLCNLVRYHKLDYRRGLFIQAHGGLRGAIGYSLAMLLEPGRFPNRLFYRNCTATMVLFSVYVLGATIKPLVRALRIKIEPTHETTENHATIVHLMEQTVADDCKDAFKIIRGSISIRQRWENWYRKINNIYLKQWLMADVIERNYTHSSIMKKTCLSRGTFIELKLLSTEVKNNKDNQVAM